jgi:hypothetical protein
VKLLQLWQHLDVGFERAAAVMSPAMNEAEKFDKLWLLSSCLLLLSPLLMSLDLTAESEGNVRRAASKSPVNVSIRNKNTSNVAERVAG